MVEGLNNGADVLIQSLDIYTTTGKTNRPIIHLYPLEVTAAETSIQNEPHDDDNQPTFSERPVRQAGRE